MWTTTTDEDDGKRTDHWYTISSPCEPLAQVSLKDEIFVVRNGYRELVTNTLMPIQQYAVFSCFFSFLQNIGLNNFTKLCSSVCTHKTSKEIHRMHTPYADTDVLQNLCVYSVYRSGFTKGTCNQERSHFACSITSLDICL